MTYLRKSKHSLINYWINYEDNTKEKMIINLMEEVINILSTCKLDDPEFQMYDVMKDAVEKEVRYPLYD